MLRSSFVRLAARSCAGRWTNVAAVAESSMILTARPQTRSFADISMAQLKEIRAMSGAPIVDCKKALTDSEGDLEKAMDWLRQHGAAKAASKVSGREAVEGLVAFQVSEDGKTASIVKVSSETDFAGRSSSFVDLVTHVAGATLSSEKDGAIEADTLKGLKYESKSVQTALEEAIVAIRENLGLTSATKLSTADGMFVGYVHGRVGGSICGLSAAVVELVGDADPATMQEAGKKLAMHIVAAKPEYLDAAGVPADIVAKERDILQSQVRSYYMFG
jgi:elongation factor Ts